MVGSTAIELYGMLTGGVTLLHADVAARAFLEADDARAFPVRKTWPGFPGVPSSKPESVTYSVLAFPGSKARPVTNRLGTRLAASISVHEPPPLVVRRSWPLAVPNA